MYGEFSIFIFEINRFYHFYKFILFNLTIFKRCNILAYQKELEDFKNENGL